MANTNPAVILRLGSHAEKDYFLKTLAFWDGLIVGANLLEAAPGATSSLILKSAGEKNKVPYYIDPMTYAFGTYVKKGVTHTDLDWIKSDQKVKVTSQRGSPEKIIDRRYKRSYRKLASEFEGAVAKAIQNDAGIADLDDGEIAHLCHTVINYQVSRVRREFEGDSEYRNVADLIPPPAAVFAPYFYIDPNDANEGLALFSRCAHAAATIKKEVPIHAVLCTDVSVLNVPAFLHKVTTMIMDSGVAGVWLWFSRFYEERADPTQLANFRKLVEGLRQKVEVYNMHGGFLSLAFSRFGLNGVSHGVGYGEQKDVIPVIGQSTPTVRYYLPDLRRRLGVPEIERALRGMGVVTATDFFNNICGCAICRGVIQTDIKQFAAFGDLHYSSEDSKRLAQTPAAARRCRFHFLLKRLEERDRIMSQSAIQIAIDLQAAREKWRQQPTIRSSVDHLARWESILRT